MKKCLCLVALLSLCSMLVSACGPTRQAATPTPIPATATQPRPTAVSATATTVPPTATPVPLTATPAPTTAPATATPVSSEAKPTAEARIVLSQVSVAEAMPGIVHVAGRAQVFEATLAVALVDASGQTIARGAAQASMGAPEWGDFAIDFYYPPPVTPQQVTLQAFEPSPKDGSPNNLVERTVVLLPVPDLVSWQSFDNPTYAFAVRYPSNWYLNQGSMMPAPPLATKLSTYQTRTPGQPLGDDQSEIWITVSDAPSVAEMDDLKAKGYTETAVVVGGQQGVRYTAPQPGHGVYDVVYTLTGKREYRLQLSAATHSFDSIFALVLATFTVAD